MLLKFADWISFEILKFSTDSLLGKALSFFIYDTIKILLLIFVLIFIIGIIRSYIPQSKLRKWLNKTGIKAYFFAALSLPEAVMLRRVIKLELIMIFFAVTTLAIIFTGYLFNVLQKVIL